MLLPAADSFILRTLEKVKMPGPRESEGGALKKKVQLFLLVVPAPVTTIADG